VSDPQTPRPGPPPGGFRPGPSPGGFRPGPPAAGSAAAGGYRPGPAPGPGPAVPGGYRPGPPPPTPNPDHPAGYQPGPAGEDRVVTETGHPAVDAVLRSLANAARLAPAEQIAEYEAAHQVLQETLASIDG